ncbi:primosomal protein N' (replication factor Y) - superfamily II helicase [Oceanomicrobium pacificus]|uniref:Primosomal protein N' (Replication factor Y)-superfamily II helicase n=1 Tax=Oceanomicrobium pacificus TaxID=2692916 RepID=A0A6B0TLJ3_9RHOB|nr:primosomal protein N' (replication factor Y) - superfamily II helicase [Oceanomicrobium pacificus]MXU65400.1 primosomal protein N' (replication factor Y) - superfamily II helicase [Oceanomicrobium pacificus]
MADATATPSDSAAPTGIVEHRFPCPSCGSDMRFLPGSTRLLCDHCGHEEAIAGSDEDGPWQARDGMVELDFEAALRDALPEAEIEETRVVQCTSCGAQVEFDPAEHAAECPFCASPIVTDTGAHRHIKPAGLLPFAISEEEARSAMTRWLGRLWFAPNGLKDYARKGRRMQGIYAPYWTYDADTATRYRGRRGTVYTEQRPVRVMVDGKARTRMQTVQKVRWRKVSGRVARFFDDVLVLASTSLPKAYTDRIAPWDLSAMEPYQPAFLAGFRAEGYTVPLEDGYREARQIMQAMITRDVKFDIGGDRQDITAMETDVRDVTFKHVLLPIWVAAYKYRGRTYRFVVNGRTGAVEGERPFSAIKITIAVILGLLAAAALGYIMATSQ